VAIRIRVRFWQHIVGWLAIFMRIGLSDLHWRIIIFLRRKLLHEVRDRKSRRRRTWGRQSCLVDRVRGSAHKATRVKDELKDNSFWFGAAQLRRRIRGSNRKKGGAERIEDGVLAGGKREG
jgi:hypothetical protein